MIIVPELKTVVLLVPRTGSGSLYRALLKTYPKAFMLYRHMEADGVPIGYNAWPKVGVVRDPIDRLWSYYKFCKTFGSTKNFGGSDVKLQTPNIIGRHDAFEAQIRESVNRSFEDWLLNNHTPFAYEPNQSDLIGHPIVSQLHYMPENRKSQWVYLRPDLGTEIYKFWEIDKLAARLGIELEHHNATSKLDPRPYLTVEALEHINRHFAWDLETTHRARAAA
jgi:hypothetical protein